MFSKYIAIVIKRDCSLANLFKKVSDGIIYLTSWLNLATLSGIILLLTNGTESAHKWFSGNFVKSLHNLPWFKLFRVPNYYYYAKFLSFQFLSCVKLFAVRLLSKVENNKSGYIIISVNRLNYKSHWSSNVIAFLTNLVTLMIGNYNRNHYSWFNFTHLWF